MEITIVQILLAGLMLVVIIAMSPKKRILQHHPAKFTTRPVEPSSLACKKFKIIVSDLYCSTFVVESTSQHAAIRQWTRKKENTLASKKLVDRIIEAENLD